MSSTCPFMKTATQSPLSPFSQPSSHQHSSYVSRSLLIPNIFIWLTKWCLFASVIHPHRYLTLRKFGWVPDVGISVKLLQQMYSQNCCWKWGSWQSPLAGPKFFVDSMWSLDCRNGEWEYARCLIFLCFFLARKFQSVQEVMSSFVQSLVSPLVPPCARENSFS